MAFCLAFAAVLFTTIATWNAKGIYDGFLRVRKTERQLIVLQQAITENSKTSAEIRKMMDASDATEDDLAQSLQKGMAMFNLKEELESRLQSYRIRRDNHIISMALGGIPLFVFGVLSWILYPAIRRGSEKLRTPHG